MNRVPCGTQPNIPDDSIKRTFGRELRQKTSEDKIKEERVFQGEMHIHNTGRIVAWERQDLDTGCNGPQAFRPEVSTQSREIADLSSLEVKSKEGD